MINHQDPFDQLPNEIKLGFKELNVPKHLNAAGFKKKFGFTCAFLFRLVFVLLFHQKNWFRLLESNKGESFPGKDTVYRCYYLGHLNTDWPSNALVSDERTGRSCFRSVEITLRSRAKTVAPNLVRNVPDIFCLTFTMRRSRSACNPMFWITKLILRNI